MTLKTPAHAERMDLPYRFHRVDSAVALDTTDAAVDVRGVVEKTVIRKIVYPHPLDRTACAITLP